MKINWENDLPFIPIELTTGGKAIQLTHVLIDTGAASSLFNVDRIFENGMTIEQTDTICKMIGIGGTEHVIQRQIENISIADNDIGKPTVQFGEMDYGFNIDGILGSDILRQMSAIIDFDTDTIVAKSIPDTQK